MAWGEIKDVSCLWIHTVDLLVEEGHYHQVLSKLKLIEVSCKIRVPILPKVQWEVEDTNSKFNLRY